MMDSNPYWTAPKQGHDWTDPVVLSAVDWLSSFVCIDQLNERLSAQEKKYHEAISARQNGRSASCFDEQDKIAWYLLQGRSFATDRAMFDNDQVCQIIPYLRRLGMDLELLKQMPGIEIRALRLMTQEKAQPDSGIFEFLVASAYARNGWKVEFVPETPGISKQPDLHVRKPGTRWAVECKRLKNSNYEIREKLQGEEIAKRFHDWCRENDKSLAVDVIFKQELTEISVDFLVSAFSEGHVSRIFEGKFFTSEVADVRFRPIKWAQAHSVLRVDDVFYGSSRMIEILKGEYQINAQHSMSADWIPSDLRPAFAEWVDRASVVSWWSDSKAAKKKRVRHFKQTLQKAEQQLPGDRPGIVHIGCPGQFDNEVEGQRHFYNWLHLCDFKTIKSRLRWVNAYLLKPEHTNDPNETWAFQETAIQYRVAQHNTRNPLPNEMMVVPVEDSIRIG